MTSLYLAGIYASNFSRSGQLYLKLDAAEKAARDCVRNYLESYHYVHRQRYVDQLRADGVKIFLDSGAFSAFTLGKQTDLPAYCNYINRNKDIIRHDDGIILASVLDGIGDPLQTYRNQLHMESLGVTPLPCFHYGEDERWLEFYLSRYAYITLGGMVPISTEQLIHWLDRIWDKYLVDKNGVPRVKVHGFGLTTQVLMDRYPWYSIDSSTWVQNAAMGMIFFPGIGGVPISGKSPDAKNLGRHFSNMSPVHRAELERRISQLGFDVTKLQNNYLSRWAFNCWSFTERNNRLLQNTPKFSSGEIGLF